MAREVRARWVPSHAEKIIKRLERDVFPWLGARPVGEITAPDEARGNIVVTEEYLQRIRRFEAQDQE